MGDAVNPALSGWDTFHEIVGSAAATLTGLTFIVITLSAQVRRVNAHGLRAFITPSIMHFSMVLSLAASSSMPGHTPGSLAWIDGAIGAAGLVYVATIGRSIRAFVNDYVPVFDDWLWNVILPCMAYGGLLAAALGLRRPGDWPMHLIGASLIFLLLIGIHNAWDIAVWHIQRISKEVEESSKAAEGPAKTGD